MVFLAEGESDANYIITCVVQNNEVPFFLVPAIIIIISTDTIFNNICIFTIFTAINIQYAILIIKYLRTANKFIFIHKTGRLACPAS